MELIVGTGRGFSAWLIKLVTRSPITHAAIRYPIRWDGPLESRVLHSTIGGVQMTTMDYIRDHYDDLIHYRCKFPEAEAAANATMQTFLGAKYDYLSYIGLGLAIIFRLKKNPLGQYKALMCTEVPAHFLNRVQEMNPSYSIPHIDPEMLTPRFLFEFCEQRTDLFERI